MEVSAPSPGDMFYYSAAHEVLICTSCHYAIQPDAITRHLKEIHHILRSARKPYVAYAGQWKLRSAEDVVPPRPDQFPVPWLPVEQGWICLASECSYMCVSTKRMQNHWPASHGRKGSPDHDWMATPLQTFFRGNMLRYFTNLCVDGGAKPKLLGKPHESSDTQDRTAAMNSLQLRHHLDPVDTRILKHYFDGTYQTFMLHDDAMAPIWLRVVPGLAHDHLFLFHGILACTALHMAYLNPEARQSYVVRAMTHQETAIPLFRYALDHPTSQNCNALVAFGYLLAVYAFAADTENSNNPLFMVGPPAPAWDKQTLVLPQWLHFLRSGCCMLCDVWDSVETGPVRELAYAWEVEDQVAGLVSDDKKPYLDYFLSLIPPDASWSAESTVIYKEAATMLAESFAYMSSQQILMKFTTWNILGLWPMRVEDSFIDLLAERHPAALILLAYYCVILKQLEGLWYFRGRSAKLLTSVVRALDERWHGRVQEAMDQVLK
ncbi:hypothetical protein S40285_08568 [Stachybotrys chlorohalonatus IBT 40285]|uniref:C2H2-type domain-containing protein n=1 Tax=Stachybotrys chlorohalonatus (strain IBT 40285) TaxID=1283841 RepID=A0A084QZJ5_STAC4|nr:hypothetical protein S40285_08568 [Stachybotrys chlorohalonata IBT 40285]